MLNEPTLRKWHRYAGVGLAPLVLLQAASGLFLSYEWLVGFHTAGGQLLEDAPRLLQFWDWVFIGIHYGGGSYGAIYHALLGMGLVGLVVSGVWIFRRTQVRMKKR